MSNPVVSLVSQMLLCLSQIKFCLHSAVFGSSYDNVCTYVKSQANYTLTQNQEEAENRMTCFVYIVYVGEGGGGLSNSSVLSLAFGINVKQWDHAAC